MTPYELVFTEADFESRVFPMIRAEAEEQDVDSLRSERFGFLSTAADVIRSVTPEEAPPEALDQYRALLFHAYHFWDAGRRVYVLDTAVARYLVEAAPKMRDWSLTIPISSAYVQLPANLFWSSISPDTPPEPVDGFFITLGSTGDSLEERLERLEILLVLGIHRARAGFSVIPLSTEVGVGVTELWAAEEREGGDFANVLPGGEIAGLYSMLTTGEVLKLVGRILWYIDSYPEALVDVPVALPASDDEAPSSYLEHLRVTLAQGPDPASM
jgi:hypothetical protein